MTILISNTYTKTLNILQTMHIQIVDTNSNWLEIWFRTKKINQETHKLNGLIWKSEIAKCRALCTHSSLLARVFKEKCKGNAYFNRLSKWDNYIWVVCGLVWFQERIPKRHVYKIAFDWIGLFAQNMLIIWSSIVNIFLGGIIWPVYEHENLHFDIE